MLVVKEKIVALIAAGVLAIGGASGVAANQESPVSAEPGVVSAQPASDAAESDATPSRAESQPAASGAAASGLEPQSTSSSYAAHKWNYSSAPLYYTVRGKAQTSPSIKKGKTKMSEWDSLGRTQRVVAKVTYKMVEKSAGWRESMPAEADEISGWGKQALVSVSLSNGRKYNGYAWNRSHLLADCLGGHAVKRNLVTGTRTQNVGNNTLSNPGGMQYTENLALNYLRANHDGWVYYKATPVYKGSELVCRSVYVDIKSDDGSIDQHVEVYNAMRGVTINYKTGAVSGKAVKSSVKSSSAKKATTSSKKTSKKKKATSTSSSGGSWVYITNTGTKYHKSGCHYLKSKIKISLAAAKAKGYTACKVCGG